MKTLWIIDIGILKLQNLNNDRKLSFSHFKDVSMAGINKVVDII